MDTAKPFRFITAITAFFVAVLLISNIASSKILDLGWFTFDGGTIIFPLSYIIADILTEVYGYRQSRPVIWLGFACLILMSAVLYIVGVLPPAADWPNQSAYDAILGLTPRIVLGSLTAYFAGEFLNSFVLSKMKIATKGRWLFARTIGSTLVGELADTAIFIAVAFWGVFPMSLLIPLFVSNYIFKVGVEVFFTPLTYKIVAALKQAEGVDAYDTGVNYNPFRLS